MTDIQPGDRVRVTLEGEVANLLGAGGFYVRLANGTERFIGAHHPREVEILEKAKPPVVEFKPGDRVRSKKWRFEFTVGHDGYFDHTNARWWPAMPDLPFTSDHYELVELVKKPF